MKTKRKKKFFAIAMMLFVLGAGIWYYRFGPSNPFKDAGEFFFASEGTKENFTEYKTTDSEKMISVEKTGKNESEKIGNGKNSTEKTENGESANRGTLTGDGVNAAEEAKQASLRVHVCGAVCHPGVYLMKEGDRLIDAVLAAGGFTEEAEESYCNQAARIKDGERIYIPTRNEIADGTFVWNEDDGQADSINKGKININTASAAELAGLKGIGNAKAEAIVAYRAEHGAFQSCEDLMKVPGIKEAVYQKIIDEIETGP